MKNKKTIYIILAVVALLVIYEFVLFLAATSDNQPFDFNRMLGNDPVFLFGVFFILILYFVNLKSLKKGSAAPTQSAVGYFGATVAIWGIIFLLAALFALAYLFYPILLALSGAT